MEASPATSLNLDDHLLETETVIYILRQKGFGTWPIYRLHNSSLSLFPLLLLHLLHFFSTTWNHLYPWTQSITPRQARLACQPIPRPPLDPRFGLIFLLQTHGSQCIITVSFSGLFLGFCSLLDESHGLVGTIV